MHAKVMPGELTTAIGAIGDPEGVRAMGLDGLPGVDQVIPISRPYKLASSELSHHASDVVRRERPHGRRRRHLLPDRRDRAQWSRPSRRWRWRARWPPAAPRCSAAAPSSRARRRSRSRAWARGRWRSSPPSASRPAFRWSPSSPTPRTPTASPSSWTWSRWERATCRTTGCSRWSGRLGKPVLLKRGLSSTLESC